MAARQKHPEIKIEIDGGVKLENMPELVRSGADFLVMGSAIFAAADPPAVIKEVYKTIALA